MNTQPSMNTEHRLREALQAQAAAVRPSPEALAVIRRRTSRSIRRVRRITMGFASLASGVAATAAAIVVGVASCSPAPLTNPPQPGDTTVVPVSTTTAGPGPSASASTQSPTVTPPANADALVAFIAAGSPLPSTGYQDDYGGLAFVTPSGNIDCGLTTVGTVVCIVIENSWPASTGTCSDGEWVASYVHANDQGVWRGGCYSNPLIWPLPTEVLPYGSTLSTGMLACRSELEFIACVHLASRNGFVISREAYQPYGTVL